MTGELFNPEAFEQMAGQMSMEQNEPPRTWHEDIIDAAMPDFPAEGPAGTVHYVAVALLMDGSYITAGRTYATRTVAQAQATRLSKAHDDCNAYVVTRSQATRGPVYVVRCYGYQLHVRMPR